MRNFLYYFILGYAFMVIGFTLFSESFRTWAGALNMYLFLIVLFVIYALIKLFVKEDKSGKAR